MAHEATSSQEALDRKTLAEADAATAAAERSRAEAAKFEIEAGLVKAELASKALTARALLRQEEAYLASDYFARVYRFEKDINPLTAKACMTLLSEWSRLEPGCAMEVVFNSPGGSIVDGMALYDFIQDLRASGHMITTSCLGMAASMAGILLQAGDRRTMGRQSWLMIHEASFGAGGKTGEVEDRVEWVKRIQERILDIFAERCLTAGEAATQRLTRGKIKASWTRKDWWVSSDEALKYGLIDSFR